jgi:hypothetical protein
LLLFLFIQQLAEVEGLLATDILVLVLVAMAELALLVGLLFK